MSAEQDIRSFRDLIIWQRAIELSVAIYEFTRAFPGDELYGLRSQLRRASVSVASNIAEGCGRRSSGEFMQFLGMARGSNYEVQTQMFLAQRMNFGKDEDRRLCEGLSLEVEKMLNSLMQQIAMRKN